MERQVVEFLRQALNYLESKAVFSSCGLYRWSLTRNLDNLSKNKMLFVGLNPSRANDSVDDPTLKRIVGFCDSWGYGYLVVVNLFARIGPYPDLLRKCSDPIGMRNNNELSTHVSNWAQNSFWDLWLGWGAKGSLIDRNVQVINMFKPFFLERESSFAEAKGPLALGLTNNGNPSHPLYLSRKKVLKTFNWRGSLVNYDSELLKDCQ